MNSQTLKDATNAHRAIKLLLQQRRRQDQSNNSNNTDQSDTGDH